MIICRDVLIKKYYVINLFFWFDLEIDINVYILKIKLYGGENCMVFGENWFSVSIVIVILFNNNKILVGGYKISEVILVF